VKAASAANAEGAPFVTITAQINGGKGTVEVGARIALASKILIVPSPENNEVLPLAICSNENTSSRQSAFRR
jgi:hypothetical protein